MADECARKDYVAEWLCNKCKKVHVFFCKPEDVVCVCKNVLTESSMTVFNMSEKEYDLMKLKEEKQKAKLAKQKSKQKPKNKK